MIRIERPPASPEFLDLNGERRTRENNECRDRYRDDYRKGIRNVQVQQGCIQPPVCEECSNGDTAQEMLLLRNEISCLFVWSGGTLQAKGCRAAAFQWGARVSWVLLAGIQLDQFARCLQPVQYDPQTQSISACRRYSACSQPPRRRKCGTAALRGPRSRRPSATHSVPRCGRCFCYTKRTGNHRGNWVT